MNQMFMLVFPLIVLTDLCDTTSQLFLKTAVNSFDLSPDSLRNILRFIKRLITSTRVWAGFVFSSFSLVIWLFVLSKAELNLAYCLDSMRYIFITLASMFILKERITRVRWFGIISIVLGIIMVGRG
ncbi:MAG: EamA family transporter [Candidatus Omnitrophota bacterium]